MRYHQYVRALIGAVILAASTVVAAAAPSDYRFELVQAQPAGPGKTTITVRLVHVPDNKPVPGAVLFESKTDMGPGGMAEMTGKVSPLSSDQPGIYRFQIETGMAGKWALNLAGKGAGRHRARQHRLRGEVTSPRPLSRSPRPRVMSACAAGDPAYGRTGRD